MLSTKVIHISTKSIHILYGNISSLLDILPRFDNIHRLLITDFLREQALKRIGFTFVYHFIQRHVHVFLTAI